MPDADTAPAPLGPSGLSCLPRGPESSPEQQMASNPFMQGQVSLIPVRSRRSFPLIEREREGILPVLHDFSDKRVLFTSVPRCKVRSRPLKKALSLRAPKTGLNETGSAEVGSYSADSFEIFSEACGSDHKVA